MLGYYLPMLIFTFTYKKYVLKTTSLILFPNYHIKFKINILFELHSEWVELILARCQQYRVDFKCRRFHLNFVVFSGVMFPLIGWSRVTLTSYFWKSPLSLCLGMLWCINISKFIKILISKIRKARQSIRLFCF